MDNIEDTLDEFKYAIEDIKKDIKQLKKEINALNELDWECDRIETETQQEIYALQLRIKKLEEQMKIIKCVSK